MPSWTLWLGQRYYHPVAINEFEKAGFNSVFDKTRVNIVLDHFVPNKDIKSAQQSKQCREFANKYDIAADVSSASCHDD